MGSLTSLMDIAQQSLIADQNALNITSNNVANQNTPGYTREVVSWQPDDAVTLNGQTFYEGITSSAVSQRDRVLDQRVQQQTQVQAQSQALDGALQQVENIFGLSSSSTSAGTTALGTAIDSFFNSFSSLAANPTDTATRQSVLDAANTLASNFNSASNQISQIATGLSQQVSGIVGQVNSLTAAIASLNQQIGSVSPNSDAGSLEDQRQQAINQLSQLVGLDQISTESNGITLTTSNGAVLVDGGKSFALGTTDAAGATDVVSSATGADITAGLTGGQLGGVLEARDQQIPAYQSSLDNLAYAIGTQVNSQNVLGLDENGVAGAALFTLSATATGAASAIAVSTTDPSKIAAAASTEGAAGNSNAQALADLASATLVGGSTADGFYSGLLGQIGNDASAATTDNSAQQATLTQLTTQRDSLSGVSLDEEAANLTTYQRSYEAAAKVFTIVDQVMADALNLGEQTTVS
ncbi:flagellar hook-associated protein 1 [Edaphobacter acidisoli]|uniref:Flagellar hook-associated protein 1 n=1 Tax=Edaphobacter acidisoli TaxID=2040573 RepID=A0A916W0E1_9BACT|nr:flagellar hook-associated protein FlgK [Edaphobacter acidisoli]GGA56169.1 flagellar hook-associated protein 1 [Edaphobacter acidisoli]